MSHKFLHSFFCTCICLLSFVILFNYLIDPYGIFSTPLISGLNQKKPRAEQQLRLIKALKIIEEKPTFLLAGSSRVHVGLNKEAFGLIQQTGFNLGLPATTVEEILSYFEHALYNQQNIETLILGLDFFMFNRHRKINVQYDSNRLNRTSMIWDDYVGTLFTIHALKNSFLTFLSNLQYENEIPQMASKASRQLSQLEIDFLRDIMISHEWYGKYEIDSKQISSFQKIVALCLEKNIQLKVFFSPAQAVYWEAVNAKGLWPKLEELKETLCRVHPILDFSGYNCITTLASEKSDEPFFSDCSHYTPFVGQMIISKLYDVSIPYSDFGKLLTPSTVQSHLDEMRNEMEEWSLLNQEIINAIRHLI